MDNTSYDTYRKTLKSVSDEIESRDLKVLCFLCRDLIQSSLLENIKDALDLFDLLEDRRQIGPNDLTFLAECLYQAERVDLMKTLGCTAVQIQQAQAPSKISPFRLMLHRLSGHMINAEIKLLKLALKHIKMSRQKLDEANDAFSIFILLEQKQLISPENVEELLRILKQLGDAEPTIIVQEYIDKYNLQTRATRQEISVQTSLLVSNDSVCQSISQGLRKYKISSSPKGVCVIINNEKFEPIAGDSRCNHDLRHRTGSNKDAENVKQVFDKLGFTTRTWENKSAASITRELSDLAADNHSIYDAFVCCILSHGEESRIFGSDCVPVDIQSLLRCFHAKNAPTLKSKPKMFFIQACQGHRQDEAVEGAPGYETMLSMDSPATVLRPDVVNTREATVLARQAEYHRELPESPEMDCAASPGITRVVTLPLEADFLLGFATVPGYVSYRSKMHGTWYMSALCAALDKYHATVDLVSILTMVNDQVSRKDARQGAQTPSKQMPMPVSTLRKRVYL